MNNEKFTPEQLAVLAKHDDYYLEILLKQYKGLIISRVRKYYIVGSDFNDIIQEAMLGFTKAVRDYNPEFKKSFINFAMLCISRQITTALTTANRQKMIPLNYSIRFEQTIGDDSRTWGDIIPTTNDTEKEVIDKIHADSFSQDILNIMSQLEIDVCHLMIKGYKLGEISRILDRSVKSIDNTMQRIKHKMTKYLEYKARGEKYVPKETGARVRRLTRIP